MKENAVQVVPSLFRRDGKPGLLDQTFERAGGEREPVCRFSCREIGEILRRQGLKSEPGPARYDHTPALVGALIELELGTVRKLPHDVVKHMGGNGRGALLGDFGRNLLDDLD